MSDASLTNISMVRPKGPKVFLAALGVGVVAAAAWWLTRDPGAIGEPEDPRKLLVVGEAEGVAQGLTEVGFVATQGTFEALAAEGVKEGASGEGIEAILHLADLQGYGYVALENPASHGIAGIKVTAESADVSEDDRWAVFSVGELGKVPTVTVDPDQSVLPLPPYVEILRAAFKQERLASTLFAESQLPMNAVELHAHIKNAIELHGGYAMLDRKVNRQNRERTETLVDGETSDPKPKILGKPLEQSTVVPLGDGNLLTMVQGWHLDSPWDAEVSMQPNPEVELWYQPAADPDPASRKRCDSLHAGAWPLRQRMPVVTPGLDALLVPDDEGYEVWTLDTAAGSCAFSRQGKVQYSRDYENRMTVPNGSGRVLRVAATGDDEPFDYELHLWSVGKEAPDAIIAMPGCTNLGMPLWLDEGFVAATCQFIPPEPEDPYYDDMTRDEDDYDDFYDDLHDDLDDELEEGDDEDGDDEDEEKADEAAPPPPPPEQVWIYVVRLDDQKIVAIPGTVLSESTGNFGMLRVPGGEGLDLLAAHPWDDRLFRLTHADGPAALFTAAEPTFEKLAEADAAVPRDDYGEPVPVAAPPPAVDPETGLPTEPPPPLLRPAFAPIDAAVVALGPEGFTAKPFDIEGDTSTVSISPKGNAVVYIATGGAVETMSLVDGKKTTLSSATYVSNRYPRFTHDGSAVVFTSFYDGDDREEHVGRLAAVK